MRVWWAPGVRLELTTCGRQSDPTHSAHLGTSPTRAPENRPRLSSQVPGGRRIGGRFGAAGTRQPVGLVPRAELSPLVARQVAASSCDRTARSTSPSNAVSSPARRHGENGRRDLSSCHRSRRQPTGTSGPDRPRWQGCWPSSGRDRFPGLRVSSPRVGHPTGEARLQSSQRNRAPSSRGSGFCRSHRIVSNACSRL
jgi:hypothetical protein